MSERPWYREPAQFFAEPDGEWPAEAIPAAHAEVAVRQIIHLPQTAPGAPLPEVRYDLHGQPQYAYVPAVQQPYDPLPARMYGCGVMGFGILSGVALVEVCSYVMFAGMATATHAVIGIAGAFAFGSVALIVVRLTGGVRIKNFHQGDGSTFQAGR
jgi:hypothetical protein